MKPVVIIAIAVVCSVAAVLGVLVVLDQIATNQAQQAYDKYQIGQFENQSYQEELDAIEYKINREVCVELFGNSMSMGGESNPYANCLDYGSKFQLEDSIRSCNQLDMELVRYECELKHTVNYYNSIMPKLQALSEQHRIDMGYDEITMNSLSADWKIKSELLEITHESVEGVIEGNIDFAIENTDNLENEENVSDSSTPIQSEEILTLSKIKNDYSECKKNEQYGNGCYNKLKDNMDEYCRNTTGNSYPEYDECFAEITKIQ